MYVTLRRYAGAGGRIEEIARKVREGLAPMLKGQPGFRGYCALASEDGDAVSATLFDDRAQAMRANERVRAWVQAEMPDLLPEAPEVFAGEPGIVEAKPDWHAGRPPYVLVRKFDGLPPVEETYGVIRQHTLPLITGSPGFRAAFFLRHEQEPSRGAVVTLFDTREDAVRSHEQSVRVFREKTGAAPPRVMAGLARFVVVAAD